MVGDPETSHPHLSSNNFQYFPHSLRKLSDFFGQWMHKLDGYKCDATLQNIIDRHIVD